MKYAVISFLLILFCFSGCAHVTVDELTDKYKISFSTETKNTLFESENAKDNRLDIIIKGVVTNLDNKFNNNKSNIGRDNINIKIEVLSYGVMLKRIPPTRHWVTYKVDIIDNNNKVLGSRMYEDGQPGISDIVDEITENIYKFSIEIMQDKLR